MPNATKHDKETIASKVDDILKMKDLMANANTENVENDINRIVYKLFGLSDKEIEIVESE